MFRCCCWCTWIWCFEYEIWFIMLLFKNYNHKIRKEIFFKCFIIKYNLDISLLILQKIIKGGGSTRQHYQICDVKYLNIKLGRPNFNHSTFTIFISTVFYQNSFITVITRRNGGKPVKIQYFLSFRLLWPIINIQ